MININDKLLEQLNESELWLLVHLVKRFNKDQISWPSNKRLCADTGWSLRTLQKIKTALLEKGILIRKARVSESGQKSNEYSVNTELIGVYIPAKNFKMTEQNLPSDEKNLLLPAMQEVDLPHEQNIGSKVLTSEVLISEEEYIYDFSKKIIKRLNQFRTELGIKGECNWSVSRGKSINARFKEGKFTEEQIIAMLKHRCGVWKGTEWEKYLTPDTLFRPTKFIGYMEQYLSQPAKGWEQSDIEPSQSNDRSGLPANFTW